MKHLKEFEDDEFTMGMSPTSDEEDVQDSAGYEMFMGDNMVSGIDDGPPMYPSEVSGSISDTLRDSIRKVPNLKPAEVAEDVTSITLEQLGGVSGTSIPPIGNMTQGVSISLDEPASYQPDDDVLMGAIDSLLEGFEDEDSVEYSNEPYQPKSVGSDTAKGSKVKSVISSSIKNISTDTSPEGKLKKVKVVACCVLAVVCIVILVLSMFRKDDTKQGTTQQTQQPQPNTPAITEPTRLELQVDSETFPEMTGPFQDNLIVDKVVDIVGNSATFYIEGETTKNDYFVRIPVSMAMYNSIEDGCILKISFHAIKMNNNVVCGDIQILEVID